MQYKVVRKYCNGDCKDVNTFAANSEDIGNRRKMFSVSFYFCTGHWNFLSLKTNPFNIQTHFVPNISES